MKRRILPLLLALALSLGLMPAAAAAGYQPRYQVDTTVTSSGHMSYGKKTELSKAFAVGSGVLGGDGQGNLNWDKGLTRVEAATMIIRLMGLEEEAKAAAARPSAFSDAPGWARGYLNLAYERGISKGVGNGRFDPDGACGVQDFLTMLYRLTRLTEGSDYAWSTAVSDFKAGVAAAGQRTSNTWQPTFSLTNCANQFADYFSAGGTLTRESAADALYLMLLIDASPEGETFADLLAEEYGLSDMLLFHCGARRTGTGFTAGQPSITYENLTGATPTVVSVKDGKLYVADPHKAEMSIAVPTENAWAGEAFSCANPIPLPKQDVATSVVWNERFQAGYDEDGDPVYGSKGHSVKLYIYYTGGTWTLSQWSRDEYQPDYALLYAYQSDSHWDFVKAVNDAGWNDENPAPEVQALAAQLTAGKSTGLAKAEAISSWVATHIYYDYPAYQGRAQGAHDALSVLESRKAACEGYAMLTRELMRCAGLECYIEDNRDHAWNVARLDGKWTVIDNTWDSPLRYEFKEGGGWEYRSSAPDTLFSWLPSVNRTEPEGTWMPTHFNANLDNFYTSHKLTPDPIVVTRETTNISQITLYES